ncbi:unnamed protein product, partial [Symbiodinium pilosum]
SRRQLPQRRWLLLALAFCSITRGPDTASSEPGTLRPQLLQDLRDPRLALYSPKHRRDVRKYRDKVLAVAGLQSREAPRLARTLRRRSGSAALEEELPCAVGVHHGLGCLQRAMEASAAGARIRFDSVLLPWNCPKDAQ